MALMVFGALNVGAAAQQPPPGPAGVVVRATLDPPDEAVVGQQVHLTIDVLFPGEMPFPPRIAVPVVPGAQAARFETQALTVRERIDGEDHVGKRFEIVIYPRRGGELPIPPIPVTLLDKAENETGTIEGPPALLHVRVPPGIDPARPVVASTAVTMTETWSPAPETRFTIGQALQRTVVRSAAGVLGLAFGALDFSAPRGVHAYVDSPQVEDRIDHSGEVTGRRVDHVTYAFETPGTYALPALNQQWWDLHDQKAQTIPLPEQTLSVVPAAAAQRPRPLDVFAHPVLSAVALVAVAAAVIARLGWPALRREWYARRRRRAYSEPSAFRALRRAAPTGRAADTYRAFTAWRRHLAMPPTAELAAWQTRLDRALFGPAAPDNWSREQGQALVAAAARARRGGLRRRHRRHPALLPALN